MLRRIGEDLEAESFFRAEAFVRIDVVFADADDDGVLRLVLRQVALEVVRFERATRGEVLRVEVEDDPLALELVERDGRRILTRQLERRRGSPFGRRSGRGNVGGERGGGEQQCSSEIGNVFHANSSSALFSTSAADALGTVRSTHRLTPPERLI